MTDQTETPQSTDPWSGYAPFRYQPDAPAVEVERMPLFYMGDTEYTAPKRVSAPVALKALENAALKGVAFATYQVVLDSIGEDAFKVLTESHQVPYEEAQEMITQLGKVYFGQAMGLAGK